MRYQKEFFATAMLSFMVLSLQQPALAEGPNDPAPVLQPNQPNGKTVLFDNSHGQTAGQSDWVIDGAFSDFADALVEEGYLVKEHRGTEPLSLDDLNDVDVFVIPEAQIPFKAIEQDAIASFAENGGGVFFIADHYNADRNLNRWDSNEIMNGWRRGAYEEPTKGMSAGEIEAMEGVTSSDWLSDEFGVRFRFNAIDNTAGDIIVPVEESFGITEGIQEVSIHAGSTMAIMNEDIAKGIVYLPDGLTEQANSWGPAVDQGVYFGGGIEEGPFVAIGKKGDGKSAFIGDSSPVEDSTPKYRNEEHGGVKRTYDGFIDRDNGPLLVNVIHWLAEQEDYHTFAEIDLPLDEPSPILEMETPEHSTEPQVEPWRAPQTGYLWYDRTTFANGSYGSDVAPPIDISYQLETPAVLPADGTPFQVRITLTNMQPNQVITNADMQVYLQGGTAVSQIQRADGSWPNGYGYQSVGTLRADGTGKAEMDVTMRLGNGVTEGPANIRLRVGAGNNVVTKAVTIGTGEEEEQPPVEEAAFTLSYPNPMPLDGSTFPVEVVLTGLTPGQTISNAQLQVYIAGGQSISQIQRADGSWPTNYGYFNVGDVTANQQGRGSKTVNMRLNETVQANLGSIRLRLGSGNNVLTETVTLQAVQQTSFLAPRFHQYVDHFQSVDGNTSSS
ncbi:DNA-binding protein [Shouchella lehensis]|uniref:DNA-binding protein n=1 Tax=Shouchella lehensis TaxID=300825 RepID=UPI0015953C9C|nr:DNA-binding protein [Shouchella lehensis]